MLTLSGPGPARAGAGVASFASLSIARTGAGYRLGADAGGGLAAATSAAFNVTPAPASQLVFTVQPSGTAAGSAITPAVRVTVQDALGNTVTGFGGNVTVAIATNPSGGTLSGTTTVAAASGVVTFAGLSIDRTGGGYKLAASAPGLPGVPSAPLHITAGGPPPPPPP